MVGGNEEGKARDDKAKKKREKSQKKRNHRQYAFYYTDQDDILSSHKDSMDEDEDTPLEEGGVYLAVLKSVVVDDYLVAM